MVRAAKIEGLLQQYMNEYSLGRADALYSVFPIGKEKVAKILRARYKRTGVTNPILQDVSASGLNDVNSPIKTKHTKDYLRAFVKDFLEETIPELQGVLPIIEARVSRPGREE